MKNNKVYYGEYSLDYWIELILNKNIIIPSYQRRFAWNEAGRSKLMDSLKNNEFVPPVVIGCFDKGGQKENLLIDGQQRLTSILLSYLGYFPDRKAFETYSKNNNFSEDGEFDEDSPTDVINWNFSSLLEGDSNSVAKIRERLESDPSFKKIGNEEELDIDFYKNTFLGFSYLVPDKRESQQKFYSSVFRNINRQGLTLSGQESRESLYYLDDSKTDFFKPQFLEEMPSKSRIDFIRYLAIISQYAAENSNYHLCSGFGGSKEKLELYYEEYISFIIDNDYRTRNEFVSYLDMFDYSRETNKNKIHEETYSRLEELLDKSGLLVAPIVSASSWLVGLKR